MSTIHASYRFPQGQILEIAEGDLTREPVDAIVNAANSQLQHGGGVAAAISHAGGPDIQRESDAWVQKHGPVSHAQPAYTGAGRMPARYVIHAVGPMWGSGKEDAKLADAVSGSLQVAEELGLHSIALPAISMGIFGFPAQRAVDVILGAIRQYFEQHPTSTVTLVRISLMSQSFIDLFTRAVHSWNASEKPS